MKSKNLYKVVLDLNTHYRTGKTRHYNSNGLIQKLPSFLQIESNPWVLGEYYLIHYDSSNLSISDTLHNSITEAMNQAEWEFNIKAHHWKKISKTN